MKLEMSSGANVKCLAWSSTNNYLACGCDNGLLKVLKIDTYKSVQTEEETKSNGITNGGVSSNNPSTTVGYLASPSNILLNQTLEGHSVPIQVISWNNVYNKLTTSDSRGLIVVWMLYKGSWYEEMVNNRNKSTVRGLSWSKDGEKICIVYEDGGVIVGSSDGNRLWSKELKGPQLTGVCWAPNSSMLLFSLSSGEVHVYDSEGKYLSKLHLDRGSLSREDSDSITAICWHSSDVSSISSSSPHLSVVYKKNLLFFFTGIADISPQLVKTALMSSCAEWSPNGQFFAVGGSSLQSGELDKVRIYALGGTVLYDLNMPVKGIVDLAWDSWSLRLAIGVGANIFFANVRPFYKAAFFGGYMYLYTYTKSSSMTQLVFWDLDKVNLQEIPGTVIEMKGNKDVCAILNEKGRYCTIAITNAMGNAVDSIKLESIQPFTIALTESLVVGVAKNGIVLWRYLKTSAIVGRENDAVSRERIFHIDDEGVSPSADIPGQTLKGTKDAAICADAKETILVIGRESGALVVYSLPYASLLHVINPEEGSHLLKRIFLNVDGNQLAMIDNGGCLTILNIGHHQRSISKKFEKKDIWDLLWASDNPNLLCIMEKTRLYIIMNGEIQDPIVSSGYLLSFTNLEVMTILLDEIMQEPESPKSNFIVKFETRSLRDTRALLKTDTSLDSIFNYVEENSHPVLWKILAQKALQSLDFKIAETAFVRCRDYGGVQFTKRLLTIESPLIQSAEIAAYFNDFTQAEASYRKAGRKDLIMEMWSLLGKWHFVDIESMREGGEESLTSVYSQIGDSLAEGGDWGAAKPFYDYAAHSNKIYESCLVLEDYLGLGALLYTLPPESELLKKIAHVLASVGYCELAVTAYINSGMYEEAVQCCITLNNWNLAMELAQDYELPSSSKVMVMYACHLISQDEIMQAIDLFRQSSRPFYGAIIAVMFLESDEFNVGVVRKLFGLAAFLLKASSNLLPEQLGPSPSLDELFAYYMPPELVPTVDIIDWLKYDPWRGLNAINCFTAVQRKIYTKEYREAIRRGIYLLEYADILGEERVGCIIGLTSANWEAFHVTSQAFMLLESFDPSYSEISSKLFSDLDPIDLVDIRTAATTTGRYIGEDYD